MQLAKQLAFLRLPVATLVRLAPVLLALVLLAPALLAPLLLAALLLVPLPASAADAAAAAADGAEPPPAADLLACSIAHHDPQGRWRDGVFRLELAESRPSGSDRDTTVVIDRARGLFELTWRVDGRVMVGTLDEERCDWTLDGSSQYSQQELEEHRLTCERLQWLRNYYLYLWGLPMKLAEANNPLAPLAAADSFQGRPVWALRVAYEEPVGDETWLFYLDRGDCSLVGSRFFHDEAAGDGEYIVFSGAISDGGVTLPAARAWYTNQDQRLLGTDTLYGLAVGTPERSAGGGER